MIWQKMIAAMEMGMRAGKGVRRRKRMPMGICWDSGHQMKRGVSSAPVTEKERKIEDFILLPNAAKEGLRRLLGP